MKIPFFGFLLLLFLQISQGNIPIAFYGLSSDAEPTIGPEFERLIRSKIMNLKKGKLVPEETIEQYKFEEGIEPNEVELNLSEGMCLAMGCRVLVTGKLQPMDMSFKRTWWPNRGNVEFIYSLDLLIIDGVRGTVLFNGSLISQAKVKGVYLPDIPKISNIDALIRHENQKGLLNQLGEKIEYKLAVLLDRLEHNIEKENKELESKKKKKGAFSFGKKKKKSKSKDWIKKSKRKKGFNNRQENKKKKFGVKSKKKKKKDQDTDEDEDEDEKNKDVDKEGEKEKKKGKLKKVIKKESKEKSEKDDEKKEETEKPKKKKKKKFGFTKKK